MEEFLIAIAHSQHGYKRLLELGVKPEDARYVLPEATTTEIVVTMNMRSLRNFFQLRLSRHAQAEIRFLAEMMLTNVYKHAPNVFFDIVDKHIEQELKYGRSIRCYFDGSGTTDTVG
jgi:thymidylate synthase (FAD)